MFVPANCLVAVAPWRDLTMRRLDVERTGVAPLHQDVLTIRIFNPIAFGSPATVLWTRRRLQD